MNKKHHTGVFMMEMMAVVFFFILCASICIMAFVRADCLSRSAEDLNQSVLIAQSVAEVWKEDGHEGLVKHFSAQDSGSGRYVYNMGFDKIGESVLHEQADYIVTVSLTDVEANEADITVSCDGKNVYTLQVARHEELE